MRKATSLSASEIFNPSARSASMNAESTRKMRNATSLSASRSLRCSFFICFANSTLTSITAMLNCFSSSMEKPERAHLARIIRIGLEVENASPFPVIEESFALNLARVARDGEVNVLTSSFRKVHALKRTRRPIRLVARSSAMMMFDQRELHLTRIVRLADRPVPAANSPQLDSSPQPEERRKQKPGTRQFDAFS